MKTYKEIAKQVNGSIEKNYENISKDIEELVKIFVFKDSELSYDQGTQLEINRLLNEIARNTGTFEKKAWQEKDRIIDELTVTDETTGDKIPLIDIDSVDTRVSSILSSNNIYSCLKSLALSNNCAHIFDNVINKKRNAFIKYYNILYPGEIDSLYPTDDEKKEGISFYEEIKEKFPKIPNKPTYDLKNITEDQFEGLYQILFKKTVIKRDTKIMVLRQLRIPFDYKNFDEIDHKFQEIANNKNELINSYLSIKYNEGFEYTKQQNNLFAVKNYLVSMIGQLISQGKFKNVTYELIETPEVREGFNNMLIIDDRSLSYYIEVHIPNYIATELTKKYGLAKKRERSTSFVPTKAVYSRNRGEVRKIFKEIRNGNLDSGLTRAEIITRGYVEDGDSLIPDAITKEMTTRAAINEDYSFKTDEIKDRKEEIEQYLESRQLHTDVLERAAMFRQNENYSQRTIQDTIHRTYLDIYNNFNIEDKYDFIIYSINNVKHKDIFSKTFYKYIYNNIDKYSVNLLAKMIIYKDDLKYDFLDKKKKKLTRVLNNENTYYIKKYVPNLINDYLDKTFKKYYKTNINDSYKEDVLQKDEKRERNGPKK